jgi:hypothetical protein
MSTSFLDESIAILTRTPATLSALLRDLPEAWTTATEGPETWSPHMVVSHLIHAEKVDWIPRLQIILEHGTRRPFEPFDRQGPVYWKEATLAERLDEFSELRQKNLATLGALRLQPSQLELQGTHPAFGPVTARQLLATWTAHDLGHILQITRTMARRYKQEVGPWAEYLSVMA